MKLTLMPLPSTGLIRVQCEGMVTLRYLPPSSEPLQELLGPYCVSHRVLVDLGRATGIDTSGVSWLLQQNEAFRHARGRLVLHSMPYTVSSLLDLLQLLHGLDVASNEPSAEALALAPEAPEKGASSNGDDATIRPVGFVRPPRAI